MPTTARFLLAVLGMGAMMGLIVVGATAVARREVSLRIWLGGLLWGSLTTGMIVADCKPGFDPGMLSNAALLLVVVGCIAVPIALTWTAERHYLRWFLAQLVMLLNIGPIFFAGLLAALCRFT
jgi:hypothetical protein